MNLSPDPQLATSTMDYDALLLKETKTNNDNVYLKSRFEELKETHQNLISQLVEHKIINAEEWFEKGDISSSLDEVGKALQIERHNLSVLIEQLDKDEGEDIYDSVSFDHPTDKGKRLILMYEDKKKLNLKVYPDRQTLKEENKKLKEEIHSIKIAMGCDGPLSWDITDILKWIEYHQDQLEIHRKATIHEHTSCYEGRMMLVKTLWEKEEDWRKRIDLDFPFINKEIANLKKENKRLEDGNKSLQKQMKELREDTETYIRETYGWEGFRCPQRGTDGFPLSVSELKEEIEEETGLKLDNSFKVKDHKEFLESHGITEEEFKKLVTESKDYDLPIDKEGKIEDAMNFQAGLHGKPQADWF